MAFPTANGNDALRPQGGRRTRTTTPTTSPARSLARELRHRLRAGGRGPCTPAGRDHADHQHPDDGRAIRLQRHQVTVRGIVTGIDNLVGSTYDAIYKGDAGLWIQEANPDPAATTSSAVFIPGIRRAATNPEAVIGSDITITGRAGAKFGQVEVVPAGVGSTTCPCAQRGQPRRRRDDQLDRQRASRREGARPDGGRGPGPDHPPVLPCAAGHARDAPGRHRHRRRHHEVPRRVRRARHRRHAPVPQERRRGGVHAVVGRARRARHLARRRRRQPG